MALGLVHFCPGQTSETIIDRKWKFGTEVDLMG